MLKILQARLQQYVNHELPDIQADLGKAEEPEIKLPTSAGSSKKAREFQKNIYLCFIDKSESERKQRRVTLKICVSRHC